jgi:hypothetical protein
MAEIVKPADFDNYEDDHQVVRLASRYGSEIVEWFAVLNSSGNAIIRRLGQDEAPREYYIPAEVAVAFVEVYQQYQIAFQSHCDAESAKAREAAEAEAKLIAEAQSLAAQHGMLVSTDNGYFWDIRRNGEYLTGCETDDLLLYVQIQVENMKGKDTEINFE